MVRDGVRDQQLPSEMPRAVSHGVGLTRFA
jgi:hypothetical protein